MESPSTDVAFKNILSHTKYFILQLPLVEQLPKASEGA